ncbi:putative nucleotidyltransferase [Bacillus phage BSP38]|uniref:Putative nucleotidyltransferase n=1 Tax=Bacillus phage BSP38 TaxID=2283013 RepID=A0A345MJQ1_BPBSP|nr:nucleotidyltransferase [Bacillus phage BSP38]AXH71083.1 putative nucleotidyltransferase [Bacillus phage BSP38]
MSNRDRSFKSLVGSHNYNLATSDSDVDYMTFVYPNFDDLYKGVFVKETSITDWEDIAVHDVRKIPEYLYKSSPTFLEILFSERTVLHDSLFQELKDVRNDIVTMNLPRLFESSRGMFIQQFKKAYDKHLKGGSHKEIGKSIASAFRLYLFLKSFAESEFSDFKNAIYFETGTKFQGSLMWLKLGKATEGEHLEYLRDLQECEREINDKFKDKYRNNSVDEKTHRFVQDTVKSYVENHIREQFEKKKGLF